MTPAPARSASRATIQAAVAVAARNIVVQRRVAAAGLPSPANLRRWATAALGDAPGDLTIRVVGGEESARLNAVWRGKPYATNVLSFTAGSEFAEIDGEAPIGDLVICAPVVAREAAEQGKPLRAHWAHMVIHGSLHLLGYDHEEESAAEVMEARERVILAGLGFADPY